MFSKLSLHALLFLGLASLAACGGPLEDDLEAQEDALDIAEVAELAPIRLARADLVPEIVSGAACPVNSHELVSYRIANRGNATAPASVFRIRIRYQGSVSYWYGTWDIAIPSLAPGQVATSGTWNGHAQTLAFLNGSTDSRVRVTSWSITADDAGQVVESNERNNLLNDAGFCFVD